MLLKIKILFMDLTNVTKFLNPYFSDHNNDGHCFSLLIDYSHCLANDKTFRYYNFQSP